MFLCANSPLWGKQSQLCLSVGAHSPDTPSLLWGSQKRRRRVARTHTVSISTLFTHSNNGKHESPSAAAVDQELDTLPSMPACARSLLDKPHQRPQNDHLWKSFAVFSPKKEKTSSSFGLPFTSRSAPHSACAGCPFSPFHCRYAFRHNAGHAAHPSNPPLKCTHSLFPQTDTCASTVV